MAKRIMQSAEEEYDAKQPPVEEKKGTPSTDKWESMIEAIDDEDLLRFIADMARAQCDKVCAKKRMENPEDDEELSMSYGKLN